MDIPRRKILPIKEDLTLGQKIADKTAKIMGSWGFVSTQSLLLLVWVLINVILPSKIRWDPFPFILLNLFLSLQSAYTGPIIMISQNRANEILQEKAELDHSINDRAEKEIELVIKQLASQDQFLVEILNKLDSIEHKQK